MRLGRKAFALLMVFTCGFATPADEPPEAPPGFEWYVFEEGDTACLHPREWFVKAELHGDTVAMFFSKENIDKEGEFKTGLSVNIIRRIEARMGRPPSQYARALLDVLNERYPDAERIENASQDGMPGIGLVYVDEARQPTIVVYNFLLADDENDVLRVYVLESPQADWKQIWELGKTMLDCRIRRR
jgi:hypothetical protein